jgi:CDP-diacylglycerol--glycerol-3-phosphate 3-phosphatidyltransferase
MQRAGVHQSRWGWLLSVLVAVRAVCAVVVFYGLTSDLRLVATCVFALACVTDLLDGQIAKRTHSSPSLGGYADPAADFLLVLGAFSALVLNGVYPIWMVVVIVLMFLQFVLTSGRRGPVYDPVGKYYGAALFAAVGITLISSSPLVRRGVLVGVVLCTGASVASRCVHLIRASKAALPHR